MADNVIREFLVSLGFKLDESSLKKVEAGLSGVGKAAFSVASAFVATAAAVTAASSKIAEQYNELYFASIRAGSSVSSIRATEYAFRAVGLSAEQGRAALEGLNLQLQFNPGKAALLNMLGIKTAGRETAAVYTDLIRRLSGIYNQGPMGRAHAARLAENFGMSEAELLMQIKLLPKAAAAQAAYNERLERAGGKQLQTGLAEKSNAFWTATEKLGMTLGLLGQQVADRWLPWMESGVNLLDKWAQFALDAGNRSAGFTSTLLTLGGALASIKASMMAIAALGLGGGAAAAAGGAAAGATGGAAVGAVASGAARRWAMRLLGPMGILLGSTETANKGEVDLQKIEREHGAAARDDAIRRMHAGLPPADYKAAGVATPKGSDRDLLIRTVIGEAGNQSDAGKAAVAHTVLNRLKSGRYGDSMSSVLFAPKQFEPWQTRRAELLAIDQASTKYQEAARVVDEVMRGQKDMTNGATHFANKAVVAARGNASGMRWINEMERNGTAVQIGAHLFGRPDSQPGAIAGTPGGAGNQTNVNANVTVTVGPGTDPEQVGRAVRREIDDMARWNNVASNGQPTTR